MTHVHKYVRTYVHTYVCMYSKNRLRATHVAIIKNMKQDVSTRGSFVKRVLQAKTLYPAVDKDLQVETSHFIFLIIATCVACKQFLLFT